MPLFYHLVQRPNPNNSDAPKRFYASLQRERIIDQRELAKMITRRCTVNPADVAAIIEVLQEILPEQLAEGRIVRLGDFGSFSLTLKSDSTEHEHEFNPGFIKKVMIRFRPGKGLKDQLKSVKFERKKKKEG